MSHKYKHPVTGDMSVPPVTTIISEAIDKSEWLAQWAANQVVEWIKLHCENVDDNLTGRNPYMLAVSDDDLEQARVAFRTQSGDALKIGREAHRLIDSFIRGEYTSVPEIVEVRRCFGAFMCFWNAHEIIVYQTEHQITGHILDHYNRKLYYGGTLDLDCSIQTPCKDSKCQCHSIINQRLIIDWKTSGAIRDDYPLQTAAYRQNVPEAEQDAVVRLDKEHGTWEFKVFPHYERRINTFRCMLELYYSRHPRIAKAVLV